MNILFIHRKLPGQFQHLLVSFAADPRNRVFGICQADAPILRNTPLLEKIHIAVYQKPHQTTPGVHPYAVEMERAIFNGQAVARVLQQLKEQGVRLDLAIAHLSWGEALYFKDIFPHTPLIGYSEYYYHGQGTDVDFDPQYLSSIDHQLHVRTLNAQLLLGMVSCDVCVAPTCWQKHLFPTELQSKIRVIHEGVDVEQVKPDPHASLVLPDGTSLSKQDEVITYTARNLEPYRGFPVFMRAVAEICQLRPKCHVIIAGGDEVSYSPHLPNGLTYRELALQECAIDLQRVHFLGSVPYTTYLNILQISSVHIYLTYPFVLSWSLIEAMSAGCVIVASNTAPVAEVVQHDYNGLLVDFFEHQQIASSVNQVLNHPSRMQHLAINARNTIVQHYQQQHSLEQYRHLYESIVPSTF